MLTFRSEREALWLHTLALLPSVWRDQDLLMAWQQLMSGCDGFICISFNQLSSTLCPSVSWFNPPLFQIYSEFSFKNLSACSMKHLILMADISAVESFFVILSRWSISNMLMVRMPLPCSSPAWVEDWRQKSSWTAPVSLACTLQSWKQLWDDWEWTSLPKAAPMSNVEGLWAPCKSLVPL